MNDEPTPGAPQGAGSTDPLDDTQRVDVPRYAPTPDPRPDAHPTERASVAVAVEESAVPEDGCGQRPSSRGPAGS